MIADQIKVEKKGNIRPLNYLKLYKDMKKKKKTKSKNKIKEKRKRGCLNMKLYGWCLQGNEINASLITFIMHIFKTPRLEREKSGRNP